MKVKDLFGRQIVKVNQVRTWNPALGQFVWDVRSFELDNGTLVRPYVHELENDYAVEMIVQHKPMNTAHGSPYDRGKADCYYRRPARPHWYPDGTYNGPHIDKAHMSSKEIAEYELGYAVADDIGEHKF
jgi:hypothetical protein